MTTLRSIISKAFREAGITAVGETPDADQHAEGLDHLNNIITSLYGNELGEELLSVNYGTSGITNPYGLAEDDSWSISSVYLPSNTRLILNISTASNIFLPPNPRDGARIAIIDAKGTLASANVTLNANGRLIESSASVVLNTNSLNREWFYRADLATWVRVTDLLADDNVPWPQAFDNYLITLLAFRLNPRYGAQTDESLTAVIQDMKKRFRARYRQVTEVRSEDGITVLPSNPYSRNWIVF